MSEHEIRIPVDPANPGQFFACCGLLELAHRLWDGVESWFERRTSVFVVSAKNSTGFSDLIGGLSKARVQGALSPVLQERRDHLEARKRAQKQLHRLRKTLDSASNADSKKREGLHRRIQELKQLPALTKREEARRKELGSLLRAGNIVIGAPFELLLDWWQNEDDENPKTWAGSQQVLRIARAALVGTRRAFETDRPFDFSCVMRPHDGDSEGSRRGRANSTVSSNDDKVEPFYFDSRHGANALPLDIGFSPNELGMESKAFPAVELLCLIGLQRCRPMPADIPLVYEYFLWDRKMRLSAAVAPAAACGVLGQRAGFRFENAYRTDQRKHKGYLPAVPFTR